MAGASRILTGDHHMQIQQGLASLAETEREIELAKRAKIDVGPAEAALADARAKLTLLKNVYFPNGM